MKRLFQTLIFICLGYSAFAQSTPKPIYVIVHGAWGGSWAFKKVDSLLTETGAIVYRPSLTGQGERVHLATTDIRLNTHVTDVVNMILYEDIRDVILVGHSYGGMVITGVADSIPGRIKKLIYLDAFVPESGESVVSMQGRRADGFRNMMKNGFIVPPWVPAGKAPPKDVPHPVRTFTDSLILRNSARTNIPVTYIQTVAKGANSKDDDFGEQAERARKKSWPVLILEADHNPQWSTPQALVEMLIKVGEEKK
jgi:pimeloyl-ACP methyl ester carboxylesterase